MMALVEIKKMILWSVAQELLSKSGPTLDLETASVIGQDTKMVLVEMKMMVIWSIALRACKQE